MNKIAMYRDAIYKDALEHGKKYHATSFLKYKGFDGKPHYSDHEPVAKIRVHLGNGIYSQPRLNVVGDVKALQNQMFLSEKYPELSRTTPAEAREMYKDYKKQHISRQHLRQDIIKPARPAAEAAVETAAKEAPKLRRIGPYVAAGVLAASGIGLGAALAERQKKKNRERAAEKTAALHPDVKEMHKAFDDDTAKKVATMIATSHEYKKPNVKAGLHFTKNYDWTTSTMPISRMQGINKPIIPEKVDALAESIKKTGKLSPFVVVNQLDAIRPQTPGKKFLIDGHHRLEACKKLGIEEVPVYHGHYTGDAHKDMDELKKVADEAKPDEQPLTHPARILRNIKSGALGTDVAIGTALAQKALAPLNPAPVEKKAFEGVSGPKPEKRTYTLRAEPAMLDRMEAMIAYMQQLGHHGHSTSFKVFFDGDGNARFNVEQPTKTRFASSELAKKILSKEDKNGDIPEFSFD